jgi:hypothetical protein
VVRTPGRATDTVVPEALGAQGSGDVGAAGRQAAVFSLATQPSKGRLTGSVNGYDSHLDPILLVRQSTAMPSKETG